MESELAKVLGLAHGPVALLWADEKPEGAVEFKEGRWGCVMWLLAGAVGGKTAVCSRKTFGCFGGGVGVGFGDQYRNFPGGFDCFCRFLSSGNEACEEGRRAADGVKAFLSGDALDEFVHGERYFKDPEVARSFAESLPVVDVPAKYVVWKPLAAVTPGETPEVVVLLADPNQLSALVVLANYDRTGNENVVIPFVAGCQSVGIYPYREGKSENPRAVVGLVDLSARLQLKPRLGDNLLSFAVPWKRFQELEANVAGSFLERPTWARLVNRKP